MRRGQGGVWIVNSLDIFAKAAKGQGILRPSKVCVKKHRTLAGHPSEANPPDWPAVPCGQGGVWIVNS